MRAPARPHLALACRLSAAASTPTRACRSPFCNKIKALLDLYKVPYETLEVNPLTKKEFKAIGSDYRKVPVAMLGDEQVNDSPEIAKVSNHTQPTM